MTPDEAAALAARLLANSSVDAETGCRRWTGLVTEKGYGRISVHSRLKAVHRVAYEVWVGPIPDGHEIDHVHARGCRYRDCMEPSHLEAVTHAENARRVAALITHCPKGHEFTPDNIKWRPPRRGGQRIRNCRRCYNANRIGRKSERRREARELLDRAAMPGQVSG